MLCDDQIWGAIDALAERYRMTPSGLAKRAGLDLTTFNRSKRIGADGRQRWPRSRWPPAPASMNSSRSLSVGGAGRCASARFR